MYRLKYDPGVRSHRYGIKIVVCLVRRMIFHRADLSIESSFLDTAQAKREIIIILHTLFAWIHDELLRMEAHIIDLLVSLFKFMSFHILSLIARYK